MPNRLESASSVFLRRHADDPVDWRPWGREALQDARLARRPVLLVIGYATSGVCQRMQRESFSDAGIAALIRAHYQPILVDRDLRPDIDRTYQLAHQALQQRAGGWPLTVFLDPHDLLPFYVGTYFPPRRQGDLPAFGSVLRGLARWFDECPEERAQQAAVLGPWLQDHGTGAPESGALHSGPLHAAIERWAASANLVGDGPRFVRCSALRFALHPDSPAVLAEQARATLDEIAQGALQDHVGGGFFRCCVDSAWREPEFEKTLVDNAQLLGLFAERAGQGDAEARRAALGILTWLDEEMPLEGGGFAAAQGGIEVEAGRTYYGWTGAALVDTLGTETAGWIARHLGLDAAETSPSGIGMPHLAVSLDELAAELGVEAPGLREQRKVALRQLRLARARRAAPSVDPTFRALPNGLLLSGLARAGRALGRPDCIERAERLAHAIQASLWSVAGAQSAAGAGGAVEPHVLDDQAAILCGVLDLLECRFRAEWLDWAGQIADQLLADFLDRDQGGFWLTREAGELPRHDKPFLDEASPSGNALAAEGLGRLGVLLAEPRYVEAVERCLRAAWPALQSQPEGAAGMLGVLRTWLHGTPTLLARLGDTHEHSRWEGVLSAAGARGWRVLRIPAAATLLPAALEDKRWLRGGRVYWCEGLRCLPRFDSPVALEEAMRRRAV